MPVQDCVLCKIAGGEIPAQVVYSDDKTVAFMDINPVARGHMLVIPKECKRSVWELAPESLAALGRTVGRVAGAAKEALDADGINVLQNNGKIAGQAVWHVHFHIIPRFHGDEFYYKWPAQATPPEQLAELCERISEKIR